MLGRSLRQLVTKVNPALMILVSLGVCAAALAVVSRWYQIDIWITPTGSGSALSPEVGAPTGSIGTASSSGRSLSESGITSQSGTLPPREKWLSLALPTVPPPADAIAPLRVSNQTDHPVRVAVLAKRSAMAASTAPSTASNPAASNRTASLTTEPFHWDFAPTEGSIKGLVLSLPEGDLSLQAGDVVVAFAQDGSQQYWGPYVIGETKLPVWNSKTAEWVLIVK